MLVVVSDLFRWNELIRVYSGRTGGATIRNLRTRYLKVGSSRGPRAGNYAFELRRACVQIDTWIGIVTTLICILSGNLLIGNLIIVMLRSGPSNIGRNRRVAAESVDVRLLRRVRGGYHEL